MKPDAIDAIKERIRATAADMGIQILPQREECDHCHEPKHLTHRVKSDELDMRVCLGCSMEAERLAGQGSDGKLTVERLP